MIRSKDLAAMYTEEQREGICKWCQKYDYDKCTACALLSVSAYNPEELKKYKKSGELEND